MTFLVLLSLLMKVSYFLIIKWVDSAISKSLIIWLYWRCNLNFCVTLQLILMLVFSVKESRLLVLFKCRTAELNLHFTGLLTCSSFKAMIFFLYPLMQAFPCWQQMQIAGDVHFNGISVSS